MRTTLTRRSAGRGVRNSVRGLLWVAIGAWLVIASGCGDSSDLQLGLDQPPDGTTVDVSALQLAPLPAGEGAVHASASDTLADNYTEVEFLLSGVANTYSGPATGPAAVASTGNAFVTRVIARFPADRTDFSGRVFLEPFNTTSGPDRDVIWRQVAPLFQAEGDAWVGISVRSTSATQLQAFDPVRYADLSIPTNDTVWDMLRQLGAALRTGGDQSPLPVHARYLYMGG
jgi:hypothetical protein